MGYHLALLETERLLVCSSTKTTLVQAPRIEWAEMVAGYELQDAEDSDQLVKQLAEARASVPPGLRRLGQQAVDALVLRCQTDIVRHVAVGQSDTGRVDLVDSLDILRSKVVTSSTGGAPHTPQPALGRFSAPSAAVSTVT